VSSGKELLDKILVSEIKCDLLVLFRKNPGLIDSIDGVARRIGRTPSAIDTDLRELADLGILRMRRVGTHDVVFLDRQRDKQVQESVAACLGSLRREGGG